MYDGQEIEGVAGLRAALLRHQDLFLFSFTENLMAYALGRRLEAYDMVTVGRVIAKARQQDYKFSAFAKAIIASPAFQRKPQ